MQSKEKIQKLKAEMPAGFIEKICALTGVAPATVVKFFAKGVVRSNKSIGILQAALQVRDEFRAEKNQLLEQI